MKKIVFIFALLMPFLSIAQSLVIEDFEDGNNQNLLGGNWGSLSDKGDGGLSSVTPSNWIKEAFITTEGYKSKGMFQVSVQLNKGNYKWDPYYLFSTIIPKDKLNPKDYPGISYWHKGVAHTFRIDSPEIRDHDYYIIDIPAHSEWTLVTIDFAEMNQEGWGKRVPLNLDNDLKFIWNLRKTSGNFQLDGIQYVKEIKYAKEVNMEIKPAVVPVLLKVDGNVKTPLNSLSKKYLTKGLNFTNWGEQAKITSPDPKSWLFNEASVRKQSAQGLLGVRLPIDLDLYIVNREAVLKGEQKFVKMEPILFTILDSFNVWTKRYKLSYTIDFHAYDGTFNRANSKSSLYKGVVSAIWKRVAEHYANEKREDLFFELTNEPNLSLPEGEKIDQADWKALAQQMIDSIRTIDKTRPIIFGDVEWYSLDMLIRNTPFKDPNIIYCFHMYDPFIFTHQGASWTGMGTTKNVPFPYNEKTWSSEYRTYGIQDGTPQWVKDNFNEYYKTGNKNQIKNRLIQVKNWAYKYNVPLICNEWGAYSKSAKLSDLNSYFKTMGEIFQELDISWQVWFGIMDNDYNLLPGMPEALDLKKK
jgi:endoglucanase